MVGISKLYCGSIESSDVLRYGRKSKDLPSHLLQFSEDKKPVIVWNCTKKCNLKCIHCYSHSDSNYDPYELSTEEAKKMIDDISDFGCPVLLFSGGEPLLRKDIFELIDYAVNKNLRAVLSTNGTLLTKDTTAKLKKYNLSYMGISLDGLTKTNDRFRGIKGAFDKAILGIKNCIEADIKVGIRFTINKWNHKEIPDIFNLIEKMNIPRICFYHLVYTGRGKELVNSILTHEETRNAVDTIINKTDELFKKGLKKEVLTVDNHCDGAYLYLRMLKENHPGKDEVLKLLQYNKGNNTGVGIGCISWDGEVYANQFWRNYSFGNIKKRTFGEIWSDLSDPVMKRLKNKAQYIKGRCAECRWLAICGGNSRVRAQSITGDLWGNDPACYLTDEEIR